MTDHIINPITNRPIKIGGAVHRRLIAEGIVERQNDENELYVADNPEEAKVAVKMLKKQNKDKTKNIVIDRSGRRIVKARKRTTNKQITKSMGQATSAVLRKIKGGDIIVPDGATDAQIDNLIQQLVLEELTGLSISKPKRKTKPKPKPKKRAYKIATPEPSESESEETETETDYTAFEQTDIDE